MRRIFAGTPTRGMSLKVIGGCLEVKEKTNIRLAGLDAYLSSQQLRKLRDKDHKFKDSLNNLASQPQQQSLSQNTK